MEVLTWRRTGLNPAQTKYAGYATVYIVVIIGVLAAANFLANRYDQSWDSTHNKQFSLSDQTIKVVKGLKSDVRMVYFGDQQSFAGAKDLLDRYSVLSPKLHPDYIDPTRNPQKARSEGYRSDSPIIVEAGTRREGAKSLTEEEVTGALIRSLKTGERNVCFVNAANERSIDEEGSSGISLLKQLLQRDNYKVRSETLKPAAAGAEAGKQVQIGQAPAAPSNVEVPKDCTALVAAGPQLAYPSPIVQAIKTYVENGGRALFMLDETLKIGRSEPAAENTELLKVLDDWGVTVNKDLVLDLSGVGQIFCVRTRSAHGPPVRIASHHSTLDACADGVPDFAFPRRQERNQDDGIEVVRHNRRQCGHHRGSHQRRDRS